MITIFKTNSMKNAADYVMDVLKQVDKTNLSVMRTVIVPDRASLEAERALLKAVGGSFNIQVRTFRRLANEILPKYNYLSKQSGIMALAGIIQDNKSRLVCYTKGVETPGFVADMYDTISMMKYCRVSPEQLAAENLPKSVAGKVHDIALLYRAYLDYTADRFIDSADKMDLLRLQMPNSQIVTNGYFYLYDFDNLSAQELALVEQLMLHSLGVTVACCASDAFCDRHLYLNDIFEGVLSLCRSNGIEPNVLEQTKHANRYTRQIGDNLFRYNNVKPLEASGFAEVFCGTTRVHEVYALACRAQQYVRSGGRYRDIYAVTSDVSKYSNAIATVFDEFDIPYFCDRQFNLCDHPYSQYVLDYLLLCKNNAKLDFVLPFVKNYLFCGNFDNTCSQNEDVFHFENYCLKYNVSYDYKHFSLGKQETYFQNADNFRQKFQELFSQVSFAEKDYASQYIQQIKFLINISNLNEKNAVFCQQQQAMGLNFESKVTSQAQQKFQEVLSQAEIVLGNRLLRLEDFTKLLTVALSAVKISVIPLTHDCVVFANMAKARKHDIKFLALLGANFGAMPIVKSDCKLLSDRNLQDLALANINLEPKISVENKRERFSLFQLLQEPTQKLYVSYAATDGADSLVPSQFVTELGKLFTVNGAPLTPTEKPDEEVYTKKQALAKIILNKRKLMDNQPINMPAFDILSKTFGREADKYGFSKNADITVENGKRFYLSQSKTSVSKITDFYKCPYKFYFEYGLRVKPREVAELKAADLGNILHDVLEHYVRDMDVTETDAQTTKSAEECFQAAISDDYYKGMRNDVRLLGTLEQLKAESVRMCLVVKKQFAYSQFSKFKTELSFGGEDGEVPPVEVDYGDGKFLLIGKIDRLDVLWENGQPPQNCDLPSEQSSQQQNAATENRANKFIVIDYKSGETAAAFSEKDLYIGHKLQLLVYVKAAQNHFGYTPVGFYYFAMHDAFSKTDDDTYVYNGRTLEDKQIACALDNNLQNNKSRKLGLELKKDGDLKASAKLISQNQLQSQVEYALKMIAQAGKLLLQGYAHVSPYGSVCDYCDYKDICDYKDVLVFDERKVTDSVKKTTIENIVSQWQNTQNHNKT